MNSLFRISTAALMAISALGVASLPANAAACRDAHGRFATCPGATSTHAKAHTTTARKHAPAKKVAVAPKHAKASTVAAPRSTATAAAPRTAPHKG